ncbi:MAG: hypothetical protein AAF927_01770 [Bacteroidota bacterium]
MSLNAHHLNWPFAYPTYPGGKGGDCVYQAIINQMPLHDTFISLFMGGGFVENYKRLAKKNIFIDADTSVINSWRSTIFGDGISLENIHLQCSDYGTWLKTYFLLNPALNNPKTLIFSDPPYFEDVRSDKRKVYYKHELKSRAEHGRFLAYMSTPYIKAKVIICGYDSGYYNRILSPDRGWLTYTYMGRTRGGMREETLWMNFDPLDYPLHDYRYVGENARQRHRIKKKVNREIEKLNRLPQREREALLNAIHHNYQITF